VGFFFMKDSKLQQQKHEDSCTLAFQSNSEGG
jgi:hypothetical protein